MMETANTDRANRPAIRQGTLPLHIDGQARGNQPVVVR